MEKGLLIMKKRFIALILMILFMISANGCSLLGYTKPSNRAPKGMSVTLMDINHEYLYKYGYPADYYMDKSKIPLLSREESYILDVDLISGGPSVIRLASSFINFIYEEEKLEIIELTDYGEFILRILEDFEETTIVVSHEDYLQSFSCDVLLKMQPNEVI